MKLIFNSESIKKIAAYIFVVLFLLIFILQNYEFIKINDPTQFTDSHLIRSLQFYDNFFRKKTHDIQKISYPPLLYITTMFFYKIRGVSIGTARMCISFFSVIFLLAMFGIGYELGDYFSGVSVMAMAAASPHILNYSRHYFPDFPQTALTALAFYLLLKGDYFKNRIFSILAGTAMALAFLTKWSSAFYLILPFLWFAVPVLLNFKKTIWETVIFLITAAFAIGGTAWYFHQLPFDFPPGQNPWLKYIAVFIFIPSILCLSVFFLAIKRTKKRNETNIPLSQLFNLASSGIAFCFTAFPWYYWNATVVKRKFYNVSVDINRYGEKTKQLINFMQTSLNLYPVLQILVIVGIILIFIFYKQNFYKNLILPANLVFITVLMSKILCPGNRYLLSFIIFIAALGGYWVGKTGKIKVIITGLIVIISLYSILGWWCLSPSFKSSIPIKTAQFKVGDFIPFYSMSSVYLVIPQNPQKKEMNRLIYPVIDHLFLSGDYRCNRIMTFAMGNFRSECFESEYLFFQIYRNTGKFQNDFDWDWEAIKDNHNGNQSKHIFIKPENLNSTIVQKFRNPGNDVTGILKNGFSEKAKLIVNNLERKYPDSTLKRVISRELNQLLFNKNLLKDKTIKNYIDKEPNNGLNEQDKDLVVTNRKVLDIIFREDILEKFAIENRFSQAIREIDCVGIMYDSNNSPEPAMREMRYLFPGQIRDTKTFQIGKFYFIKVFKIERFELKEK